MPDQLIHRGLQVGRGCREVDRQDEDDERPRESRQDSRADAQDRVAGDGADLTEIEGVVPVGDVPEDLVDVERGERAVQPCAQLVDGIPRAVDDARDERLDLNDELRDLADEHRDHDEDDPREDGEQEREGDEERRPARESPPLEPGHGRIESECEEQGGPDVEEDRRQ